MLLPPTCRPLLVDLVCTMCRATEFSTLARARSYFLRGKLFPRLRTHTTSCLATVGLPVIACSLDACAAVPARPASQEQRTDDGQLRKDVAQPSGTAPKGEALAPCRLGVFEQGSEDVSLRELSEAPSAFEGRRVR